MEWAVTITGIITAILVGLVIGLLARLVLPGRQPIGLIVTVLVGIGAALLGTWITNEAGWGDAKGYDLVEFLAQLVLAVIGVAIVSFALRGRAKV
jgi:uncharacterized membrane protein YeaQ/YmgE (transglycosylase-associated protein family)